MAQKDFTDIDAISAIRLAMLEERGIRRALLPTERLADGRVLRGGEPMISFSDNDYLGLSSHPRVIAAAIEATRKYGAGAGAARLITGDNPLNEQLEAKIARMKRMPAARVFGSGYLANAGAIPALVSAGDLIVMDELCHASMHAGARLSGARVQTFAHNNVTSAAHYLQQRDATSHALLLTETVFSMDGDLAPLEQLAEIASQTGAWMMTDDAHGFGVVDQKNPAPIQMGTLSKAAGAYGGYVAGPANFIELLTSRARTFVYATGLPPGVLAAALEALEVMEVEPGLGAKALGNARLFGSLIGRNDVFSAIVPVHYGEAAIAMAASATLAEQGFLVTAIRPPTVPENSARLRFTFSAKHVEADIRRLAALVLKTLADAGQAK
ncbi:MAG: 8-amino-7-oxononanoate synthase [Hyphomonadaceae bacterium]|nr:8-amino-7-oxononanoate synthase [Hyphomonadaceae bacterium]